MLESGKSCFASAKQLFIFIHQIEACLENKLPNHGDCRVDK
jgi:hypothetical protein